MRAQDQRGVPVPAVSKFAFVWLRTNVNRFLAFAVVANHASILRFRINNVGIYRVNLRPESITTTGYKPLVAGNPGAADGARRTAKAVVVLGTAIHIIKRC